jgi:hypothetical protein
MLVASLFVVFLDYHFFIGLFKSSAKSQKYMLASKEPFRVTWHSQYPTPVRSVSDKAAKCEAMEILLQNRRVSQRW